MTSTHISYEAWYSVSSLVRNLRELHQQQSGYLLLHCIALPFTNITRDTYAQLYSPQLLYTAITLPLAICTGRVMMQEDQ